ncbi:MAG: ubiquinol-cytochrome c reductase iron-sulfur subunit [Gemmatimonadota bacterium]|jgi:menaquinol-cytochrome c reductase iron-sulfur subunit
MTGDRDRHDGHGEGQGGCDGNHGDAAGGNGGSNAGDASRGTIMSRRNLIRWLMGGIGGLAALAIGLPVVGVLVEPMLRGMPLEWKPVGPVEKFTVGATQEVVFNDPTGEPWAGPAAKRGAWLRRDSTAHFTAFSIDCTHLGCPVRWMKEARLFMCPCHGGVYYADGDVAAGPPPKPLSRYPVRVRSGQVQVATVPLPIT